MNVILLEKIGRLGELGDTTNVKSGYARNFLFPQGKAIPATKENLEQFEQRKTELQAAHNTKVADAQARAKKVDGVSLTIEVNASDEGKLFGSVGTKDIADALNTKTGSDITKSEVHMPHGVIRDLGDFELSLDLGYDVQALISVSIIGLTSGAGVTDDGSIIEEIDEAEDETQSEGKTDGQEVPSPEDTDVEESTET
jgi:large subunit ribosomal protein L9